MDSSNYCNLFRDAIKEFAVFFMLNNAMFAIVLVYHLLIRYNSLSNIIIAIKY